MGRHWKKTLKIFLQVVGVCATLAAIGISIYGIYQLFSTFATDDCADCNALTKAKLNPDVDLVTLAYGCPAGCSSCGSSSIPLFAQSCDSSDIVPVAFNRKVEGNLPQLLIPVLLLFFDFLFSIISGFVTCCLLMIGLFVKNQPKDCYRMSRYCDICIIAVGIILLLAAVIVGFSPGLEFYKFTFYMLYEPNNGQQGCLSSVENIYWMEYTDDDTFFDQMLYTDGDMKYVAWNWTTTEDWTTTCDSSAPGTICSGNGTVYNCVNLIPMQDPAKLEENTKDLQDYLANNIALNVVGIVLDVIAFIADIIHHRLEDEDELSEKEVPVEEMEPS